MAEEEVTPHIHTSENVEGAPLGVVPPTEPKKYAASIYPGPEVELPVEFCKAVAKLETRLGMPIWCLIQNSGKDEEWSEIGFSAYKGFQDSISQIAKDKPIAVLIESPGGDAHHAYRLGRLLQRRTGCKLTVVVPQFAKSAATLLALAGNTLILGRDAELGPLDVQMLDTERESYGSALDSVQSLERLNAFAMTALDQTMLLLLRRTGKRTDVLLPQVFLYVSSFLKPLLEKIDTLDYTKKSRELKVAEEYAARLMRSKYQWTVAKKIARQLVEKYPTHGFSIDAEEASCSIPVGNKETFGLGLTVTPLDDYEGLEAILDVMIPYLDALTIVGQLQEIETKP